jgi:NAD(P)-dependent dehydrogenase (short-subunit alcohol dehydrogenase family)
MHILITGANRGIGLELVRQYLARGETVFAGARRVSDALLRLSEQYGERLMLVELEVNSAQSIHDAVEFVASRSESLDLLINNAGIDPEQPADANFGSLEADAMMDVLRTNAVAPLLVAQAFVPLLKHGKQPSIINITSEMGSIADRDYGGSHAYCMSKAALNMASRGMAADLRRHGIIVLALDPGWVQTDMGGPSASLTPEDSAGGILRVVDGLTIKDSGRYLDYRGREHRW